VSIAQVITSVEGTCRPRGRVPDSPTRGGDRVNLLGAPFLVLMTATAVVVPVAAALCWNRWSGPVTWPGRIVSLALVMVVGAAYAGALVNRAFGFYSTVGDLLATSALTYRPPQSFQVAHANGPDEVVVQQADWLRAGQLAAEQGHGELVPVLMVGRRSGLSRHGLVYLPAAWFLDAGVSLPVVEMLHGYPGSPGNFRVQLGIETILDHEISARRMPPAVAVFPNTYERGRASECVDAVRGQADETYLAVDVPNDVQATFGTSPGRSLGLLGYSEGGFCAVNLGLHHPDRVSAAVSLAGYFTAGSDAGTKALYVGKRDALLINSPMWWVRHRSPTAPALLLVSGIDDAAALREDRALARTAHRYAPKLPVIAAVVPHGAHNFATFDRALPAALDFLGQHLPAPLAPLLRLPGDPGLFAPAPSSSSPRPRPRPSFSPAPSTVGTRRPRPSVSARSVAATPRPSATR
jgi:enterochelin esterase-like enzyme